MTQAQKQVHALIRRLSAASPWECQGSLLDAVMATGAHAGAQGRLCVQTMDCLLFLVDQVRTEHGVVRQLLDEDPVNGWRSSNASWSDEDLGDPPPLSLLCRRRL